MNAPAPEQKPEARSGCRPGCLIRIILLCGILLFLFRMALGPIGPGNKRMGESFAMQQARTIGLSMFQYSIDNQGAYPDGQSSTEVFQKLIDGQYCSDPSVFYIPRAGKFKPVPGEKLKPENVCFDVTCCLDSSSGNELPVVFTTGYKVTYAAGGAAIPLKNSPQFNDARTWLQWWDGDQQPWGDPGIAVCYKSNRAWFLKPGSFTVSRDNGALTSGLDPDAASKGIIPSFISPDFKPNGKTYRQLTPDGPLP